MIQRKAVRAVIMTPNHRVLLMKLQEPVTGFQLWIAPGGLKPDESEEEGLLVQADYFDPVMDIEAAPDEASAFREFHWWSIDAIARSAEKFAPRNLHCLLESISKNGPPNKPIPVGV